MTCFTVDGLGSRGGEAGLLLGVFLLAAGGEVLLAILDGGVVVSLLGFEVLEVGVGVGGLGGGLLAIGTGGFLLLARSRNKGSLEVFERGALVSVFLDQVL